MAGTEPLLTYVYQGAARASFNDAPTALFGPMMVTLPEICPSELAYDDGQDGAAAQ